MDPAAEDETVVDTLRYPRSIRTKLDRMARADRRSRNSFVVRLLERAVAEYECGSSETA